MVNRLMNIKVLRLMFSRHSFLRIASAGPGRWNPGLPSVHTMLIRAYHLPSSPQTNCPCQAGRAMGTPIPEHLLCSAHQSMSTASSKHKRQPRWVARLPGIGVQRRLRFSYVQCRARPPTMTLQVHYNPENGHCQSFFLELGGVQSRMKRRDSTRLVASWTRADSSSRWPHTQAMPPSPTSSGQRSRSARGTF